MNLPYPLTVSEQLDFPKLGRTQIVKLTAGVHRQTWVSGNQLFVDVHISNSNPRPVKKITLRLEKVTMVFAHAAPGTKVGTAEYLRLPDRIEREVVAKASLKLARHGWEGVPSDGQETRTLNLNIPHGLVTVDTGT